MCASKLLTFSLVIFAASVGLAQKQDIPKNIADSIGGPLHYAEAQLMSIAEAMPEDKYGFIPSSGNFEGVRSFGEQIKHVACAQIAFYNEIEGKTPPDLCEKGGPSKAKTKAELIQYLKDSYDYGDKVLATISERNAQERAEGRYAGPNTKLGLAAISVGHLSEHYGQLVVYLRLNGIVPPGTVKYGLKVR
jgi:uncharacterized damage-inducible protein DinB